MINDFRPLVAQVQVTFTVYSEGLAGDGVKELQARLQHHGVAIRWIRRNLRSAMPFLEEDEQKAVDDWLDNDAQNYRARAEIASGKLFKYVSGHEGVCIRATAQRINVP
ncbi:hypothetical protein [Streptomyces atratus]|uniref:hypothetical protein n=1 Tax=Streptomyces atratus TaxID=1893 RepID=UPI003659A116